MLASLMVTQNTDLSFALFFNLRVNVLFDEKLFNKQGKTQTFLDFSKIANTVSFSFQVYIEKYRNLTYLEQINDEMNKTEQDRLEVIYISVLLQIVSPAEDV